MHLRQLAGLVALLQCLSCAPESDDDESSSADTDSSSAIQAELSDDFPDFYELAKHAAPSVTSDSVINAQAIEAGLLLANFGDSYETSASAFQSAFGLQSNLIGQVLNDAGVSGPVKSIFVLLAGAQSTLDDIDGVTVSDDDSSTTDDDTNDADEGSDNSTCTKITATTFSTPFFKDTTNQAFNDWDDEGKYTCAINRSDEILIFGSSAIESPSEGCEASDAYEFYVMEGGAQDDQTNTEQVATRGSTRDFASIKKFYYNGCSGELKIIYAQSTLYSAGVEFSSRTELTGNIKDNSFTLRSNFIDADTSFATHNTFVGQGQSKKSADGEDDAYFLIGYRSDDCGDSSDSSSCTLGTDTTFCVTNSGTGVDFSLASATSSCSSYESTYQGIEVLSRSDLPNGYFEVTASAAGL